MLVGDAAHSIHPQAGQVKVAHTYTHTHAHTNINILFFLDMYIYVSKEHISKYTCEVLASLLACILYLFVPTPAYLTLLLLASLGPKSWHRGRRGACGHDRYIIQRWQPYLFLAVFTSKIIYLIWNYLKYLETTLTIK